MPARRAKVFTRYEPLGPVLAVMPWNFPFWQVFRFAAPALMAGNVGLLKHASNVPQCAPDIETCSPAPVSPKAFSRRCCSAPGQSSAIIDDPRVKAVSLTGSEPAGQSVAAMPAANQKNRARTRRQRPVHRHAVRRPRRAAQFAVTARMHNNGQSCIAAKRFMVHTASPRSSAVRGADAGAPRRRPDGSGHRCGPAGHRRRPRRPRAPGPRHRRRGRAAADGGKPLDRPGQLLPAHGAHRHPPDSPGYSEELFGPVACCCAPTGIDDAIHIANDTDLRARASAWTNDPDEQQRFIAEIEAGMVFINGMTASDPELPFGGTKRSGYGRELAGLGIREFGNVKTVWVA